jgi:hypothetical protein
MKFEHTEVPAEECHDLKRRQKQLVDDPRLKDNAKESQGKLDVSFKIVNPMYSTEIIPVVGREHTDLKE